LTLAPVLVHRPLAIAACLATALLMAQTGFPLRTRLAILALCMALGLMAGARQERSLARIERQVESSVRFSTITAPIEGNWDQIATGYRLSASRFSIGDEDFAQRITIYLSSPPPAVDDAGRIVARGFLRMNERNVCTLTCKSARLIVYEGKASRWHPRYWNRLADARLDQLAESRDRYARPIALTKALVLGRSGELAPDIREDYRRGGTYHLLVFSGMQIAMAAAAVSLVFRRCGAPRLADWSLFLLALLAPLFAGNEPSVSRASLMIGVYAASRLMERPTPLENLFFVCAFLQLLLNPGELRDAGFALTYAATGGLLFVGKPLARQARRQLTATLLYGLGAEVATVPLTLYFFHQAVLGGALVTMVLAPVLAAMLGAGALACGFVFVSESAAVLPLELLGWFDQVASGTNFFFGETLRLSRMAAAPPAWLVICTFAGFLLLDSLTRGRRALAFAPLLVLPSAFALLFAAKIDEAGWPRIEFLDVGQGDAILLRAEGFAVLVDGGGRREDREFGRRILMPKLLDRGVRRLDAVLLTHPHPDHCEGLRTVLATMPVAELWMAPHHLREPCANELANAAFPRGIPVRLIRHRDRITLGAFAFEFFVSRASFKRAALNNSSVVCKVRASGRTVLLTGDLEKEGEAELAGSFESVDALKVAHHGSRNSSTPAFLHRVSPRVAIISCGGRNPFGHPHPSVLAQFRAAGVRTWRTDRHGDIALMIREGRINVSPQIDTFRGQP